DSARAKPLINQHHRQKTTSSRHFLPVLVFGICSVYCRCMSFVCLYAPAGAGLSGVPRPALALGDHSTDLVATLLTIAPHAIVDARGLIWIDAHGFDATAVAAQAYAAAT